MIIDAYTFCWNEEIRLKYFLRQWAPICRRIRIYDNGSDDNSMNIAKQYDNVIWDTTTYGQGNIDDTILLHTKNNGWKNSIDADLVFMGDVDEFVYHPDGLLTFFENKLSEGYTVMQPYGYDMISKEPPIHDGMIWEHEDFKYGQTHPNGRQDKCVTFSPKHIHDINFDFGAHHARPFGNVRICRDTNYKLLHYKYIGREYYAERTRLSGERLCELNRRRGWGKHYLTPNEQVLAGFDLRLEKRKKII